MTDLGKGKTTSFDAGQKDGTKLGVLISSTKKHREETNKTKETYSREPARRKTSTGEALKRRQRKHRSEHTSHWRQKYANRRLEEKTEATTKLEWTL